MSFSAGGLIAFMFFVSLKFHIIQHQQGRLMQADKPLELGIFAGMKPQVVKNLLK